MTEAKSGEREEASPDGDLDGDNSTENATMRALLRRALAAPEQATSGSPSAQTRIAPSSGVLHAVHRKIRKRSRGRFFSNGWSTSQSRINYGFVALVMLVMLAATYVALSPTGISAP
jgi:hypothetical protein